MKLNRFFVADKLGNKNSIVISQLSFINQIKNVFRFTKGDEITLFDNSGFDFLARIESYEKDSVVLSIINTKENTVIPLRETYLFSSIVKKDNFEWIVEKATELGVSHIIPIVSNRTEKKDLNIERIQKIITEAAEQSGRGTLPILYEITELESALNNYAHIQSIAWHTGAVKFVTQDVNTALGAYIGPEGGWSQEELGLFKRHGLHTKSLGPQILKSETAVVAVLSRLVF
ncbi:MAG: RsmE family RNA methyltransferase [Patescibacteria group bacterium]